MARPSHLLYLACLKFPGNQSFLNSQLSTFRSSYPNSSFPFPATQKRDFYAMGLSLKRLHTLVLFLTMVFSPSHEQKDLVYDYNGFNKGNVSLDGIAFIHPNGLLQLTNTANDQIGRAFYSSPVQFKDNSSHDVAEPLCFSFSTYFVVAVVPAYLSLSAHGLVFTISPSMEFPEAMGSQYFGIFNPSNNGNPSNHVLAIELDTVRNPDLDMIDENHVGIDVNGLKSFKVAPAAYYANEDAELKNFSLTSGEPIQVWVDYDGVEKQLNVTVSPWTIPKPDRSLLSSSIDLSSVVKDSMYVGFSASTGSSSAGSHSWMEFSDEWEGPAARSLSGSFTSTTRAIKRQSSHENWVITGCGCGLCGDIYFNYNVHIEK